MKTFLVLSVILIGVNVVAAVTHSLQYFYTASSGIPNFPEFVNLGMVDGVQVDYYDSNIRKVIPKQDWMAQTEDSEYWERQTQTSIGTEQTFKANIDVAKRRFNQTGGIHIFQWMYGCEWDDETQESSAFHQFGYDGEDFIALDLKTDEWIAPTPQAVITKHKWEQNKEHLRQRPYYFQICPEWLKKYLDYGRSSLQRTELPKISLLHKTPSSPVSCHATGFYPNRAEMFWRKDGAETHDGVVKGEIVPNNDGTFQMTVNIDLSSTPTEDWAKYECVFQLSGEKDLLTKLEKTKVRNNDVNPTESGIATIIPIVVAVVVLAAIAVIGFILYKKKNAKRPPSPVENPEVQQQMLSTA